jgi:N-acetylmuramoyl-L-alanine amidase
VRTTRYGGGRSPAAVRDDPSPDAGEGAIRSHRMFHPAPRLAVLIAAFLALAASGSAAAAARGVFLTGLRSRSAPTSTRVVFDFSAPVMLAAPDSGRSSALVVSVPGQPMMIAAGVPAMLAVRDGLVDSVEVFTERRSARFQVWLCDTARFRVFTLEADEDKPFRIVVDVVRPGGAALADQAPIGGAAPKKQSRVRVVVVDAGHGGEDTGARGLRGVLEKRANLAAARALAEELGRTPGIRAVLTRDDDIFIPLRERYRIAEQAKADLFISLHANSSPRRGSGSGTEVFFLSLRGATDQATDDLADMENAADLVGGVPAQAEDDLVSLLYDVKRSSVLQQSQLLATTLLDHVTRDRRLGERGVKQAGFVVLKSVEFPSVLVETAFLNNPVEARLLASDEFQRELARQLAAGVCAYLERSGIGYAAEKRDSAAGTAR